jgi:proline iminopeptidase
MTDDIASYERNIDHERNELLGPKEVTFMKQCESKGEYTNDRYHQDVLKLDYTYIIKHPEHSSKHLIGTKNRALYEYFQGDNEFVVTGALSGWTVADQLYQIKQRTAIIFGSDDTMDKSEGQKMAERIPNGEFHIIENAGHCSMLDNPREYFSVLTQFLKKTNE